jgi:hypothetical protein
MLVRACFSIAALALLLAPAGCGGPSSGACGAGDQNGMSGGTYTFDLTVDDTGFHPLVLSAENDATVTLTITNMGTRPHDFVLQCLPTPNGSGCPAQSCFPGEASVPSVSAIDPGKTVTVTFDTPKPEGIYPFRSDLPGDSPNDVMTDAGEMGFAGQFVVL